MPRTRKAVVDAERLRDADVRTTPTRIELVGSVAVRKPSGAAGGKIALGRGWVEERIVTGQTIWGRAQTGGPPETIVLLVNIGTGRLCITGLPGALLAPDDAVLCVGTKPWRVSGEANQIGRVLAVELPRDEARRLDQVADACVAIPARAPALALARRYAESLLAMGDVDDPDLARLAIEHLAGLVAAAAPAASKQSGLRTAMRAATLDLLPVPVFILSAEGRQLDVNAAADRLLAATRLIRICRGVLVIADQDVRRLVAEAIRAVAAGGEGAGTARAVAGLTLEGPRRFAVQVAPVSRHGRGRIDGIAALLLQEIGTLQPLPDEVLTKLYGLTRAEARLVALLARALSLEEAAATLGIARTTAKTHLRHVFEKTGTRRQTQIVRLALSAIVAPAADFRGCPPNG